MVAQEAGRLDERGQAFLKMGVVCAGVFLALSIQVATRSGLAAIDAPLSTWAVATSAAGAGFAHLAAAGASNRLMLPLVLLAGAWAWHRGKREHAILLVGLLVATQALAHGLKLVFALPRPNVQWMASAGASYPSGHSANGALLGALVAWYGGGRILPSRWAPTVGVGWALLVAWGRMLAGVHYLTDVLGGLMLGTAVACTALPLAVAPRVPRQRRHVAVGRRVPVGPAAALAEDELRPVTVRRRRPPPPPTPA